MTERLTDRGNRYVGSITDTSEASVGTELDGVHPKLMSEGTDIFMGKRDETVRLFA